MADDDEQDAAADAKESGGLKKTAISAVGIFVLVLAAQVVAPLITNSIYGPPGAEVAEDEEEEEVEEESLEDLPTAIYQPSIQRSSSTSNRRTAVLGFYN